MTLTSWTLRVALAGVTIAVTGGIFFACRPELAPVQPQPVVSAGRVEDKVPPSQMPPDGPRVASVIDEKAKQPPHTGSAVPAGIPPRQDAAIDAIPPLPPIPDASVLRDAGTPMR